MGYEVDSAWPRGRMEITGSAPMTGIALGPDGNIWTLNRGAIPIQVYTQEGDLINYWGEAGMFKLPHGMRFDPMGNLWTVDIETHTVRKHRLDGSVLLTIGVPGEPGADEAHFNKPTDVAIASNGDAYVSDGYGNNRIVVFDATGRYLRSWGKLGLGPGEFSLPHSISLDSRRRVFVADRNNVRVQIFDSQGAFLSEWRNIVTPWHLHITADDTVYVCGSSPMLWSEVQPGEGCNGIPPKDQILMKLDSEGRLKQLWSFPKGDGPGELNWVHCLALGPDGSLYLGDIRGKRVQKFHLART